jgi:hypothetical protein
VSRDLYQGAGPPYQRGVQSRWCVPTPKTHPLINARGGGVAKFVPSCTRGEGRPSRPQLPPITRCSARSTGGRLPWQGREAEGREAEGGRHPGGGHRYTPARPSPIMHERQPAQLRPVRSPRHRPPAGHRRSPRHRPGRRQPAGLAPRRSSGTYRLCRVKPAAGNPRHRHGHAQPGQTGARPAGEHAPRSHQEPRKASPRYIDTPQE